MTRVMFRRQGAYVNEQAVPEQDGIECDSLHKPLKEVKLRASRNLPRCPGRQTSFANQCCKAGAGYAACGLAENYVILCYTLLCHILLCYVIVLRHIITNPNVTTNATTNANADANTNII